MPNTRCRRGGGPDRTKDQRVARRRASPALNAELPTPRHAVDHIMETFPIVKRKDVEEHGTYRTKDTLLAIYDEMSEAIRTGKPYQTWLDPPPADPSCRHPESTRPSWSKPQSQG